MEKYFGIFKELKELGLPGCLEYDLYQEYFAGFYDRLTDNDQYDAEIYFQQAAVSGAPILELACGTGRLLLRLARKGYPVTGLDLSPDMLKILEEKLQSQPKRVREKISYRLGDMTDFSLDERFKLVILPATSICLLKDDEQVGRLFDTAYRHLEEGGRFVFDYRIMDSARPDETKIMTWQQEDGRKEFVVFGEKADPSSSKAIVNFYAEVINGEKTARLLGHTEKRIITDAEIEAAIARTDFRLVSTRLVQYTKEEKIRFIILQK